MRWVRMSRTNREGEQTHMQSTTIDKETTAMTSTAMREWSLLRRKASVQGCTYCNEPVSNDRWIWSAKENQLECGWVGRCEARTRDGARWDKRLWSEWDKGRKGTKGIEGDQAIYSIAYIASELGNFVHSLVMIGRCLGRASVPCVSMRVYLYFIVVNINFFVSRTFNICHSHIYNIHYTLQL